jgi:hypothetical protein
MIMEMSNKLKVTSQLHFHVTSGFYLSWSICRMLRVPCLPCRVMELLKLCNYSSGKYVNVIKTVLTLII